MSQTVPRWVTVVPRVPSSDGGWHLDLANGKQHAEHQEATAQEGATLVAHGRAE
jgi:hypothetical protein